MTCGARNIFTVPSLFTKRAVVCPTNSQIKFNANNCWWLKFFSNAYFFSSYADITLAATPVPMGSLIPRPSHSATLDVLHHHHSISWSCNILYFQCCRNERVCVHRYKTLVKYWA